MSFKIFPATLTDDGRKVPLIKSWQEKATDDPEQIRLWSELFRDRLKFWGVPTGKVNDLLVLDVDVKDDNGLETIKTLTLPQTTTQRTPSGGIHFIYKYPNDGKDYGNKVKFMPGLDVRGNGGWIAYYGTDQTPTGEPPQWLLEEIVKLPPPIVGSPIKVCPEIAEGIILNSLDNIRNASPGEANETLNKEAFIIGQLVGSGSITEEYAREKIMEAGRERGKSVSEIKSTTDSAFKGSSNKPLSSPFGEPVPLIAIPEVPSVPLRYTPNYFTMTDLLNTQSLRKPQLFEDWSTEDIHLTTADGGTGKTTLKLYEAICLALGERFLGFRCLQPGKTLFITGEDTAAKLGAMIGAISRQMGIMTDSVKINTVLSSIVVKKDSDLCIISKEKYTNFLQPNDVALNRILEAVHDIKPKMIVFDPISSFWGSEAGVNDMAKAVGKFMGQLVEESHACVEIINHMGKVSSGNKDMTQFAGRGGTGLPSNARVSRNLMGIDAEEYKKTCGFDLDENLTAMLCNVNKFTDGSPLLGVPFIIERNMYGFERRMVDPSKVQSEQKDSDVERVFNYLKECIQNNNPATKGVVTARFGSDTDPLSPNRVRGALNLLDHTGFQGHKVKLRPNPDALAKEPILIITDLQGNEI